MNLKKRLLNALPDRLYLKIRYKLILNKNLNLRNPKTFNEKLQWLKLNNRCDEFTLMADKYEVKEYVKKIIGEEYIIPTLGVWDTFDQIDFNMLPNKFVLKCTHDSGGLVICKDKATLDVKKAKEKIEAALKRSYYLIGREWPYKNIKPRIIAEEYMEDEKTQELRDYKIFNFNGKPQFIQLDIGRFTSHKRNMYDISWNFLKDFKYNYENVALDIDKPKKLAKMLEFAEKLSQNMPFLRTDFYMVNDRLYFGEITFFPESGYGKFTPESWDEKLGNMIDLSIKFKERKV